MKISDQIFLQIQKTHFWPFLAHFPNTQAKKSFFQLGFTPCKAEQPLQAMEFQEKEAQRDYCTQEICLERTYR